ncbi:MAG: hypothetical protein MUD00_02550 [Candidatus Pacebacteria bacterium]|jgi:hypothetical protein|nr:hypothetical protein [Candidatus Paceibacterota bacterium]
MGEKIKVSIFDWGRTLYDPYAGALFPGELELLKALASKYTLALVSLAKSDSPESRRAVIEATGIAG